MNKKNMINIIKNMIIIIKHIPKMHFKLEISLSYNL